MLLLTSCIPKIDRNLITINRYSLTHKISANSCLKISSWCLTLGEVVDQCGLANIGLSKEYDFGNEFLLVTYHRELYPMENIAMRLSDIIKISV